MHHNCCSLSSLNYVLLAQEQVNNTSSVYCSDQPCYLNRWLTKERGNPQFADSASQELANSNYISKKGSQANFAWCSVRLIKKRGRGGIAFSAWFKTVTFGKGFCVCVWGGGFCLHWRWVRCLFLVGPSYLQRSSVEKSKAQVRSFRFTQPLGHRRGDVGLLWEPGAPAPEGSSPAYLLPKVCRVGLWGMRYSHALGGGPFYFALNFVA